VEEAENEELTQTLLLTVGVALLAAHSGGLQVELRLLGRTWHVGVEAAPGGGAPPGALGASALHQWRTVASVGVGVALAL
jgi:hypothetical protein